MFEEWSVFVTNEPREHKEQEPWMNRSVMQ